MNNVYCTYKLGYKNASSLVGWFSTILVSIFDNEQYTVLYYTCEHDDRGEIALYCIFTQVS